VRFRELIDALYADGMRVFVQMGTGQLASVIDDVLRDRDHLAIAANTPTRSGCAQLSRVAAALWVEGAPVHVADEARPARPPRPPMRLDLGSPLVHLSRAALPVLAAPASTGELAELEQLAALAPAAGELAALLRETAAGALALLDPATVATTAPALPTATHGVLQVSVERMPFLLDHCFFKQREGWPELPDRCPVVPATTLLTEFMRAAEAAAPGRRAIAVREARFHKWIVAVPAVDIPLTVTPVDRDHVDVRLGDYARATIELGDAFPSAPPAPMVLDDSGARPAPITAQELYELRWMFHGPQFQAITALGPVGERHVSAVLTTPSAPGALLDNIGQVLGYWIVASFDRRAVVFPIGMERMTCHGEHPAPGTQLECRVVIRQLTETALVADAQLIADGRVWVDIEGWADHRFESHPETRPVELEPERRTLSSRRPGGWALLYERWRETGSRELFMRNHFGRAERDEYEAVAPRQRRSHLLGRIAVKDAVRHHLFDAGLDTLFPAEVRVGNDEAGRPFVVGNHTDAVPPLSVSLAHDAEVAVAIARPAGVAVGIDVQQIRNHPDSTLAFALTDDELALLASLAADSPSETDCWFTRFFAAKEAVAKAEGTGLRGNPKHFTVIAVHRSEDARGDVDLDVRVEERDYRVHTTTIVNPEDLPERAYAVAWTEQDRSTT
jgi:phosphopantetheinyl transferase